MEPIIVNENKQENNLTARSLILGFLLIFVGFACTCASNLYNPDADAYWLIETGRYIVENRGVPFENPWTYIEGLSIIIQSPLCAVLNYLWYSNFDGLGSMWQLAMVENFILLLSAIYMSYQFSKNRNTAFLTAALVEVLFITCGLITTRPYQLTTASMMLLIGNLERAKQKDSISGVYFAVAIATIFQANFQMATLAMIACFIACYALGGVVDRLRSGNSIRNSRVILWIFVFVEWAVLSMFNPYGLKGSLYLLNSAKAMSLVGSKIYEMNPPFTTSFPFIVTMVSLYIFFYRAIKRNKWQMTEAFLVLGSAFASFLAIRNFWMSIIAFSIMYAQMFSGHDKDGNVESVASKKIAQLKTRIAEELPQSSFKLKAFLLKPNKKEIILPYVVHKIFRFTSLALGTLSFCIMVLLSISYGTKSVEETNNMISFINELPEDAKIYTSFNTGSVIEFTGRKIYVDSRPELYSPNITGSDKDLLQEWVELEWTNVEQIPTYVKSNDWDYYFVSINTPLEYYLRYSGVAKLVYKNDFGLIYKII